MRKEYEEKAIVLMILMFLVVVWPWGGLWETTLKPIIGGGAEQSSFYPIYIGIIVLTGIVVGCTDLIVKEIHSFKKDKQESERGGKCQ